METAGRGDLERIVEALCAGDAAFALAFVDHHGAAVSRELARAGVHGSRHDELVHEIALALVGRSRGDADTWSVVLACVAEVVATHRRRRRVDRRGGPGGRGPTLRFRGSIDDELADVSDPVVDR
ncbi:MAG: hypothetical protein U5R31_00840 [Acidimicrobiia bacterium]|nr:hypothetical protein [Acidimicrobiia bacterium]